MLFIVKIINVMIPFSALILYTVATYATYATTTTTSAPAVFEKY